MLPYIFCFYEEKRKKKQESLHDALHAVRELDWCHPDSTTIVLRKMIELRSPRPLSHNSHFQGLSCQSVAALCGAPPSWTEPHQGQDSGQLKNLTPRSSTGTERYEKYLDLKKSYMR